MHINVDVIQKICNVTRSPSEAQFQSYQCQNNTTCYSIANIVKSGMALWDASFKARILRLDVGANVPLVVWVTMWQGVTNKGSFAFRAACETMRSRSPGAQPP